MRMEGEWKKKKKFESKKYMRETGGMQAVTHPCIHLQKYINKCCVNFFPPFFFFFKFEFFGEISHIIIIGSESIRCDPLHISPVRDPGWYCTCVYFCTHGDVIYSTYCTCRLCLLCGLLCDGQCCTSNYTIIRNQSQTLISHGGLFDCTLFPFSLIRSNLKGNNSNWMDRNAW